MLDFVRKRVTLEKHWDERVHLTNLGQTKSGISERNFSTMKCGKMAAHAQMAVDTTVDVVLRQERLAATKSVIRSDKQLRRIALPSKNLLEHLNFRGD